MPFKLLYTLVRKINLTRTITTNGRPVKVVIRNGIGLMNFVSDYEKWFDKLLPKIIDTQDAVFIDIGANIGQTMIKVLSRYPTVRYYGVEPNPHCADYLHQLSAINQFRSVKIFNCAVSDSDGSLELLSRYADDLLATTTHAFRKFTRYAIKTRVNAVTGDALLKAENLAQVSVIKIDIEGGEAMAIAGLLETIEKFQPFIICEILPLKTEDEGVTNFRIRCAGNIFKLLHQLNYVAVNAITLHVVHGIHDLSPSLGSCNYLFLPAKKSASFPHINFSGAKIPNSAAAVEL